MALSPSGLTSRRSRQPDNWGWPPFLKNLSPATHIAPVSGFDLPLLFVVLLLAGQAWWPCTRPVTTTVPALRTTAATMLIAGTILFVVAQVPPQRIMAFAVRAAGGGAVLASSKGVHALVNVGIVIQPSEILKIAMPLMLAWWFQSREGASCARWTLSPPGLLLAVPVA